MSTSDSTRTSLLNHPALQAHRAFLLWRLEVHPEGAERGLVKVPLHPDGVTRHSRNHPAPPLIASEAVYYLNSHLREGRGHNRPGEVGYLGAGFRPNPANRLVCLDLDDCMDSLGIPSANALMWMQQFQGAAFEVSIGGRGLHIWFTHQGEGPGRRGQRMTPVGAVEMYGEGQFIALGTYVGGDPLSDCTVQMQDTLRNYFPSPARRSGAVTAPDWEGKSPEEQMVELENLRSALRKLDPDNRDVWVGTGQSLVCLGDAGRALWEEWSATSERFPGGSNLEKWDTFTGDRSDYRSVFAKAQTLGWINPGSTAPAKEWTEKVAEGYRDTDTEEVIERKLNGLAPVKMTAQQAFGAKMALPELWAPDAAHLTDPGKVADMRGQLLWWLARLYGGNCEAIFQRIKDHELAAEADDIRSEILAAVGKFQAWWFPIAAERAADRAAVKEQAESLGAPIFPDVLDMDGALRDLVHVTRGQYVAIRSSGVVLSWADACAQFAASELELAGEGEGKPKKVPVLQCWRKHKDRQTTGLLSWRPGMSPFCAPVMSVEGHSTAYNTWRGFKPQVPPPNWREWAGMFERHVEYLVPVAHERKRFLQWLGHMVQHPGELPHTAYLMVTEQTGTGRGWLASALGLAVQGYAALGVPLGNILDGGFNGVLSQKLLITVDEVRAGGEATGPGKHARAQKLKELVTQEQRHINHKYGAEVVEQNAGRWLIFSNHLDALPFDNKDRRLIVIQNPAERMAPEWYSSLYGALKSPQFAASIFHFLQTLPLDGFNAGESAPMNAAKQAALAAMTNLTESAVEEFLKVWPSDFTTLRDVSAFVKSETGDEKMSPTTLSYTLRRMKITFLEGRPRLGGSPLQEKILQLRPGSVPTLAEIERKIMEGRKILE